MTTAGFFELDKWISDALSALTPVERRALFRRIGRQVAARVRARMLRQRDPDGAAWAPRARDRHGKVRTTAKMMVGLRAARRLKATATQDGSEIGWTGRMARIASVHHHGGVDFVDRKASDTTARYPVRRLIGVTAEEGAQVRALVLEHLSGRLQR